MKEKSLSRLISNRLYDELIIFYSPEEIAKHLSFENGLRLAYHLLYNPDWKEALQFYAVELLKKIRLIHSIQWKASWKNDAFLGTACYVTSKHEERYNAYKLAIDKCKHPPPGLLIEFARCSICPGTPPISYDKAIELVMQAIKETPYSEGINLLCNLYSLKNDNERKSYWTKILCEIPEGRETYTPSIEPDFLVDESIS